VFQNQIHAKENKISWSTLSEYNNDRFEIERSDDAINFIKIGEIKGKGNSNSINKYEFIDLNLKNIYYRIKQIDYDGREILTDIKYINDYCLDLKLIKVTNILGQEVDEKTKGFILLYYNNYLVVKRFNP
jgi:hypothetical protein